MQSVLRDLESRNVLTTRVGEVQLTDSFRKTVDAALKCVVKQVYGMEVSNPEAKRQAITIALIKTLGETDGEKITSYVELLETMYNV